ENPQRLIELLILLLTALVAGQVAAALRRHAEERLRRSEQRFRALIENSSDLITLLDRDGSITYVSPSIARMLGYTPADLVGSRRRELVHPADLNRWQQVFADLLAAPGQLRTIR